MANVTNHSQMIALLPQHQNTVIGRMIKVCGFLNYYKQDVLPNYDSMEQWERKEFDSLYVDNVAEKDNLTSYMMTEEPLFNEILCSYNLSVSTFVYALNSHYNLFI